MGNTLIYEIWRVRTRERLCRIKCTNLQRVDKRIILVNGHPLAFSEEIGISVSTMDEGIWQIEMKGGTIGSHAGGTEERLGEETGNNQDARGNSKAKEKNQRLARKKVVK